MPFKSIIKWFTIILMIICSLIIIFFIAFSPDLLKDLGDITYPWNYTFPQILSPIAVFSLTILKLLLLG